MVVVVVVVIVVKIYPKLNSLFLIVVDIGDHIDVVPVVEGKLRNRAITEVLLLLRPEEVSFTGAWIRPTLLIRKVKKK